ncbi:GntR family transcriptional regulator [Devosia sp. A449]
MQSARDALVASIRRDIVSGALQPGEHLAEQAIAARSGFSRGPVREALAVLQKLGFVTHERNRGMFVAEVDVSEGREIYQLRGVLEGYACALAAKNATEAEIEELAAINRQMENSSGDVAAFIKANHSFHAAIHAMSRSPVLTQMIAELLERSRKFREAGLFAEDALRNAVEDHSMMLYAIRERDGELARMIGARAVYKRWPGLLQDQQASLPRAVQQLAEIPAP